LTGKSFDRLRPEQKLAPWAVLIILLFFVAGGCGRAPQPKMKPGEPRPYKVMGKWYKPIPDSKGYKEKGIASWYGSDFHGKKTANGEIYDMHAMTAAHKTLPLGTVVRVKNLDNGSQAEMRINDRGPFVRGRIIDLSYAGAKKLGVVGPGTARVTVTALGTPSKSKKAGTPAYIPGDYYTGNFTIQIGAFTVKKNAERLKGKLSGTYKNVHITPYDDGTRVFYRVRLGQCSTLDTAKGYESEMIEKGFEGAFVIAE
jgi:rare lipoprotein A